MVKYVGLNFFAAFLGFFAKFICIIYQQLLSWSPIHLILSNSGTSMSLVNPYCSQTKRKRGRQNKGFKRAISLEILLGLF